MDFIDLKERVIDKGLCTSCGACAGICPNNAISYENRYEDCRPYLEGECIECGMCVKSCVAHGFNLNDLNNKQHEIYGWKENGNDDSYFLCHSTDRLIWQQGASGGFITQALLFALEFKIIKYAVVISNDPQKPWLPKVILAKSCEEIINAAQSKYCLVPTLEILKELQNIKDPVAMVLLPCQAHAFINIRKRFPNKFKNVVLTFGLMCGNALPFSATKDVLEHIGIKDENRIIDLKYRDGFWHGELHVRLDDNTEKGIPVKEYMRYMADFYRKDRCKICIDGDAMFTDVSSGDGWLPNNKQDDVYGWSIIHTHTRTGEKLVKELIEKKLIDVIPISESVAFQQKHLYHRHYSSIPRIENRRKKKKPIPVYQGLKYPHTLVSKKNLTKKKIVDCVSRILFSVKTRRLIRPISIRKKTGILEIIMKIWFGEK